MQHIILKIATGVAKFDGFSRNCDSHYKHSATNSPSSFYLGQRDCKKRRSLLDVPVHLMGYARSNFAKKNKRLFTVYDYNYKLQHTVQSSKIHVHFLWCDKMRINFKTLLLDWTEWYHPFLNEEHWIKSEPPTKILVSTVAKFYLRKQYCRVTISFCSVCMQYT